MAYYEEGEESLIKHIGTNAIPENKGIAMPYYQKREPEYPDIGEQLDDLFKQGAFSPEMTARIQAVKDRYAKETAEDLQARIDAYEESHAAYVAEQQAIRQREEEEKLANKLRMENEALEEYYQEHPEERP